MKENPPDVPQIDQVVIFYLELYLTPIQLKRLVCLNPRVTRMVINWDEKDENSLPQQTPEPTPFNFELSNSQSMHDRKFMCSFQNMKLSSEFARLEHCFTSMNGHLQLSLQSFCLIYSMI